MAGGIEVVDPPEEIPSGEEFLHKLPKRTRRAEETAFITDIFEHAGPKCTNTCQKFAQM